MQCLPQHWLRILVYWQPSDANSMMLLSYQIVRRVNVRIIHLEVHLKHHAVADWAQFCCEAMMEFIAGSSENLWGEGGEGRGVLSKIDENCFSRRKYIHIRLGV